MVITSAINIDMQYKYVNTYVDAVQYDVNSRNVEITLLKAGSRADIPTGSTFEVKFKRPDGSSGSYSELSNGQAAVTKKETNVIVVWLSEFILSEAGATVVSVCVKDGETEVNTFSFIVNVQESPHIGTGLARMYPNTYDATATPSDIAFGKTAYVKGEKILGTSSQVGDGSGTITPPSLGDPEYLIVNGYMGLSEAKKALARRNIDAVASVNGRTPDENGNVDLTTLIPPSVDSGGGVTEEQIAAAVAAYFAEHPAVRVAEVELIAANWTGDTSPYSQIVNIPGITQYSQVDLTPSVEQLAIFHDKDLAFVTENEDGVVTVYAIGDKPLNDYTMQVTIKEVSVSV